MPSTLALIATGILSIYAFLHLLLHYTQDTREPPPISTSIPFIGTMIQLARKKNKFYIELRNKYNLPIYTLRLPGSKLYIINSPSLIPSIQRLHKTLAFPPLEAKFSASACGTSSTANEILNTNVDGEDGDWGYSMTFHKMIHKTLSPGPGLDAMNRVMARKVEESIDRIKGEKSVMLFDFIKREIGIATTDSVYGSQNPFKDPAVAEAFWKYPPGIITMITEFFPSLLAKESLSAREFMVKVFAQYLVTGGHNSGSSLMKARYDHSIEYKIPLEDIARFEVGNTIALLSENTTPSAFWMIYHLYSDPVVLKDCREELSKVLSDETVTENGEKVIVRTLDISRVKFSCPILLSTLQEVLRFHTVGISTRLVTADHLLDGKYLLKKGNTIMIPGPIQHTNTSSWGPDASQFNHLRFTQKHKRHNPIAFRGFGGGTTLCPGRHFASTEIMAFTALLILRFDVIPVLGKWTELTTNNAALWETTPAPDQDIEVKMNARFSKEMGVKWRVLVSDSDTAMPLSAEDL